MRSDVRTNRTTTGPAALLLMFLFALGIGSAPAQSQSAQQEIQQLKDKLQQLVEEAHTVCPDSKATKGNIPVKLTVV